MKSIFDYLYWLFSSPPILAAIISFIVAQLTIRVNKRSTKSDVERSFILQRNEINDAFVRHSVRSPFAHILQVPDDELKEFGPKACLLFLQLNLLEDVFQHKNDIIDKRMMKSYTTWATKILKPWILADKHLKKILGLIYETNDIMDRDFVDWLKQLIPLN